MKVYTCWNGSYSDRGMHAVFSTKAKASKYLKIRRATAEIWDEWDDDPIAYDVDEVDVDEPEKVRFYAYKGDDGSWLCFNEHGGESIDPDTVDDHGYYHLSVKYNSDRSIMLKAAIDRAMMLYSRDSGV